MQRLACPGARPASRRPAAAAPPAGAPRQPLPVHAHLQQRRRQQQEQHTQVARLLQRGAHCRCGSAPAEGGDVLRPSAKAASPPLPDTAIDAAAAAGAASSSSSSSGGGSSSSRSASYSDFYKLVHSSYIAQQQPRSSGTSSSASHGPSSSSSSSSSSDGSDGSSVLPQPEPPSGASPASGAGAAAGGNGHGAAQPPSSSGAAAAGVEAAILKAQQALAAAESSLSNIHRLPSAQPPSKWAGALQLARSAAVAAAAGACLVASHAFGLGWQWAGATLGALAIAARAYQRHTVTAAAAVAAAAASLATLGCSLRFGLVLLAVAYSSAKLRKFRLAREGPAPGRAAAAAEAPPQQQPTRDWPEVVCSAAVPTLLAVVYGAMAGCLDLPLGSLPGVEPWRADLLTLLQGAVLGWYACTCGDAWASELGALSSDQPRLLTTLQPVRKGTHGGVTLLGLSGAAAGGLLVGGVFYCAAVLSPTLWVFEAQRAAAMAQWRVVPLGLVAGVFGSLLDSLLGSALQYTGFDAARGTLTGAPGPGVQRISGLAQLRWLSDNAVNLAAALVTAALTALAALAAFG